MLVLLGYLVIHCFVGFETANSNKWNAFSHFSLGFKLFNVVIIKVDLMDNLCKTTMPWFLGLNSRTASFWRTPPQPQHGKMMVGMAVCLCHWFGFPGSPNWMVRWNCIKEVGGFLGAKTELWGISLLTTIPVIFVIVTSKAQDSYFQIVCLSTHDSDVTVTLIKKLNIINMLLNYSIPALHIGRGFSFSLV